MVVVLMTNELAAVFPSQNLAYKNIPGFSLQEGSSNFLESIEKIWMFKATAAAAGAAAAVKHLLKCPFFLVKSKVRWTADKNSTK